ncbi:MAG: hypothetical protein LBV67_02880, partial [Streptococcaceae bacterium]|nr:hypothetical protein [Streptococcaceae bacterium]
MFKKRKQEIILLLLLFFILLSEYGRTAFNLRWTGFDVNVAPHLRALAWSMSPEVLVIHTLLLLIGFKLFNYQPKINELLKVWSQFMVYSLIVFVLSLSFGQATFSGMGLLEALFPLFGQIWPLSSVLFAFFIIKPLFNQLVEKLSEKIALFLSIDLIGLLFLLPSVYYWTNDSYMWIRDLVRVGGWISLLLIGMFVAKWRWHQRISTKILAVVTFILGVLYFLAPVIIRKNLRLYYIETTFHRLTYFNNQHWSILG